MTDRSKDAAQVGFFPPAAPLLTILAGMALERAWPLAPGLLPSAPLRYAFGGAIVATAILCLGLWSVLTMRRTGQSENPYKPTLSIVESGPFRFTRNPMYLQMVIVCIGAAIALANWWIGILTPLCLLALDRFVIRREEAYLEAKFGERYLAYKRRVRRWI